MPTVPTTYVTMTGPADTTDFFAAAGSPIVSIAGTATRAVVTLQSGAVLVYEGTGLAFAGGTPTAGTVTAVSILDGTGTVIGRMDLTEAPWAFADIVTAAPEQSYLETSHVIADAYANGTFNIDNVLIGGNQADQIGLLGGVNTVRALGGDDIIAITSVTGATLAAGTVIDGGDGEDWLSVSGQPVMDLRNGAFRSIEGISVNIGTVHLSAAQFGNGQIALNLKLFGGPGGVVQIDQVAGKAFNASLFQFAPDNLLDLSLKIVGTAGNDVQIGSDGTHDVLEGLAGNDRLDGGDGLDTIYGGDGNDVLSAGGNSPGRSRPGGYRDEVYGGAGDDRIIGGSTVYGREFLSGGDGNDRIIGGGYGSTMDGGAGDDVLRATSTTEEFFVYNDMTGGAGNDTMIGSSDNAAMYGGAGNDVYRVNGWTELREAVGEGYDRVITTVDLDLSGAVGPEGGEIERISVAGGVGLAVTGTGSANRIDGNIGADTLSGAGGDDTVSGGSGNDVLSGGTGEDLLRGGAGADTFVFATGFGKDRITDFAPGEDLIDLRGLAGVTSFGDLMADHVRQVGGDVWIDAGAGDVLILRNFALTGLHAEDFLFL